MQQNCGKRRFSRSDRRGIGAGLLAVMAGLALAGAPARADIEPSGAMLRWPDVSKTHITFVYANDIWIVPKTGGLASLVANPSGQESFPKFSEDGKTIAFVGNYDGNRDIYTISLDPSLAGTPAQRVTHHPTGENLADWSPDGGLLFMANGFGGLARQTQLLKVPAGGGLPVHLPVPYAGFGSISPDGTWLAYTPHSIDTRTWKRYRGGMATDVWLFNLKDNTSKRITDWEGTDTIPMWVPGGNGQTVYFLSDKGPEHRLNIWSYSVGSGQLTQVTKHTDFDVRWPSIGPGSDGRGEIVFQLGSELRLLELGSGRETSVKVTIPGDRPTLRPQLVDASRFIRSASISPSGKRVVVEGRGDVWSLPAKEGVTRNLSRSGGVFERDPSFSSDSKWIAYLSDESGEYELWVRPSDASAPAAADAKKESKAKDGDGAEESAPARDAHASTSPRKLTSLGEGFRYSPSWSPDSKWITMTDKAGALILTNFESGETKEIDRDPWGGRPSYSWSHDSSWIAYTRSNEYNQNSSIWFYNVATGEKTQATDEMFNCTVPTFDAKGDWMFMQSNQAFTSPLYSDLDTTFIYANSEVLLAVPLRADVKNPWLTKSDEESYKAEAKKDDGAKGAKDKESGAAEKKDGEATDDGLSGTWTGTTRAPGENGQMLEIPMTLNLTLGADGSVSGSLTSAMGSLPITGGSFNKSSGALTLSFTAPGGEPGSISGTVSGDEFTGSWSVADMSSSITARRTAKAAPAGAGDEKEESKGDDKEAKEDEKKLKIDFEGFQERMIRLPLNRGNFGGMAVTHDNKLIFVRSGSRGSSDPTAIKIYDINDETNEEKTVTTGSGAFDLSADRKKLMVMRGGSNITVMDAAAGGGKSSTVPMNAMLMEVEPRAEWRQIFTDVFRLQRDFFYEETLHGVDWPAIRDQYAKMLADCVTRDDVNWVIAEFISELNVGHAYVTGPGDVDSSGPSRPIGLLGVDYELVPASGDAPAAYRIKRILTGGAYDSDARGPLSQPGVEAKAGDYLLAVNGVPVRTDKDPWAAFIGAAGRPTQITLSDKPMMDGTERTVLVTPMGNEGDLRFRAWIHDKRAYVHEKSEGRVGYVYVPNTGVDGQNELFRQFSSERGRPALIIDERWNGGGQIPTRFIELLNRPALNYWARRDGKDWTWPPDAHNGPKTMLINGLAGSGGDMFPHLFRQVGLGKLIGTRTWGGLVGISGNPVLMDGGSISVPTFGFYELDGTWGIEGHGVDPDIEVIDDPALMVNGGDPQLDRAIELMLEEIQRNPYRPAPRPKSPDRAGMGIAPEDK